MGAEAKATLRLGAERHPVTALLETDELLVRGEHRLRVPLADIREARVDGDALVIAHRAGEVVLELGERVAAAWLEKLRNPRTLADKLGVKPGMRVALLGVSDAAARAQLVARGATLVDGDVPPGTPMVILRVSAPAELAPLERLAQRIARDGAIWVVHPRGQRDVADTVIFAEGRKAGLVATKVARFSDTDSAEKLVIPVAAR